MHKIQVTYFVVQGVSHWFPQKKITAKEKGSRRTATTTKGRREAVKT
jgi:hypothetical protein